MSEVFVNGEPAVSGTGVFSKRSKIPDWSMQQDGLLSCSRDEASHATETESKQPAEKEGIVF